MIDSALSFFLGVAVGFFLTLRFLNEGKRCFALQAFVASGHNNATRKMRCTYKKEHSGPHRCRHPYEFGFHFWSSSTEEVEGLLKKTASIESKRR